MEKIRLDVVGITKSQTQSGAFAVILEDTIGKRRLPILIGYSEAQSIAIALENIKPPRPLTHDLFKSFCDSFNVKILEVIISKLSEGVFYSKLICFDDIRQVEIDSRTSDAIALALRFDCRIFAYKPVMEAAHNIEGEEDEKAYNGIYFYIQYTADGFPNHSYFFTGLFEMSTPNRCI